ncbi:MAG: hypothetical protein HWN68_11845 [Desulfobacterales bacterium]|nr:hypothetical protein [Desulfobacterales bacterium]
MPVKLGPQVPDQPNRLQKALLDIFNMIWGFLKEVPILGTYVKYIEMQYWMMQLGGWYGVYVRSGAKDEKARAKIKEITASMREFGVPEAGIGPSIPDEAMENPSEFLANLIKTTLEDPMVTELMEIFGGVFYDTIESVFDYDAPATPKKAGEAARRYMATNVGMASVGLIVEGATQGMSLGFLKNIGRAVQSLYFATGLNWLPWVMLGPVMRASIASPLEQKYAEKFRPERMSASQLASLRLGRNIDDGTYRAYLGAIGWPEQEIDWWLTHAQRELSLGQIFDAWDNGIIGEGEAIAFMGRLGYTDEALAIIITTHRMEQQDENVKYYIGTLRKSLREGLITPAEFRGYLTEMGIASDAIDLELELAALDQEDTIRELTQSHIEDAFITNVLSVEETRHALLMEGWSGYAIDVLIRTWQAKKRPKALNLNRTNVVNAWLSGAINEVKARELLRKAGYTTEAIDVIIDDVKIRHPEIPEFPKPLIPPKLPLGVLREALIDTVIDESTARSRLLDAGWVEADIDIMVATWLAAAEVEGRELSETAIRNAFSAGVISEDEAYIHLAELGFDPDESSILISTWIAEVQPVIRWPSVDALAAALEFDFLTPVEVKENLIAQGFPESVANMYLGIMLYKAPAKVKRIPRTKVEEAYEKEIMRTSEALRRLTLLDYTLADAELLLRLVRDDWRGGNIVHAYAMDIIPFDMALRALEFLDVPRDEAIFYLETKGKAEWVKE